MVEPAPEPPAALPPLPLAEPPRPPAALPATPVPGPDPPLPAEAPLPEPPDPGAPGPPPTPLPPLPAPPVSAVVPGSPPVPEGSPVPPVPRDPGLPPVLGPGLAPPVPTVPAPPEAAPPVPSVPSPMAVVSDEHPSTARSEPRTVPSANPGRFILTSYQPRTGRHNNPACASWVGNVVEARPRSDQAVPVVISSTGGRGARARRAAGTDAAASAATPLGRRR